MERKITTKTACSMSAGDIAKAGRVAETILYHVMGICNGTKTVMTDYGESIGLRGQFEAQDAKTGEVRTAPIYWPPGFLSDIINGELLVGAGDANFAVRFAYSIGVRPDPDTQLGYVYYVDSLQEPDAADPFEGLRTALPAPTTKAIADKSAKKKS